MSFVGDIRLVGEGEFSDFAKNIHPLGHGKGLEPTSL